MIKLFRYQVPKRPPSEWNARALYGRAIDRTSQAGKETWSRMRQPLQTVVGEPYTLRQGAVTRSLYSKNNNTEMRTETCELENIYIFDYLRLTIKIINNIKVHCYDLCVTCSNNF